jgi:hypothetical protein
MNKEIESILLQFKTAIDFTKGPSRIKYNFEISDAEKLYEYIITTQKENQRLKEEYVMLQNASEEYEDKLLKENQELKKIIYTTLEYVDREEVSSVGTPFTSTSIGKEIKELLEGEKTFNSIWEENQRLNNVLNELKEWFKEFHKYQSRLKWNEKDYIEFIEHLENELKESDK